MGRKSKEQRAETRVFTLDNVRTYVDGRFTGELTVGLDTALPKRNLQTAAFSKTLSEHETFPFSIGRAADLVGEVSLAIRDDATLDVRGEIDLETRAGRQYHELLSTWPLWDVVAELDVLKKRVKGRSDVRLNSLSLHAAL